MLDFILNDKVLLTFTLLINILSAYTIYIFLESRDEEIFRKSDIELENFRCEANRNKNNKRIYEKLRILRLESLEIAKQQIETKSFSKKTDNWRRNVDY